MPTIAPLGTPALELGKGAPASGSKEQHRATIGRRHPPELCAEALVVGIIPLLSTLPGKIVDLLPGSGLYRVRRSDALLGLKLNIELEGLLEAEATWPAASAAEGEGEGEAAGEMGRSSEGDE